MFALVHKLDVFKTYQTEFLITNGLTPSWAPDVMGHISYSSKQTLFRRDGNNYSAYYEATTDLSTSYQIVTMAYSGYHSFLRIDGKPQIQRGSGSAGNPGSLSVDTLAYIHFGYAGLNNSFFNGQLVEAAIYAASAKGSGEHIWVEGYLADKYGIALPDGHLFKESPPDSAPTKYNSSGVIIIDD